MLSNLNFNTLQGSQIYLCIHCEYLYNKLGAANIKILYVLLQSFNRRYTSVHCISFTEHTCKAGSFKRNSFKYLSKRISTELSNFIQGKKRQKVNVTLHWVILDRAKTYSPTSKKCIFCLTEKYHITFSKKNLLKKCNELVTKSRNETKFYLANYKDVPT